MDEVENRNNKNEKINETQFFDKINKIDKSLGRLISNKRQQKQITNTRNETGAISTDSVDSKRIIMKYCHQF